MRDTVFRKPRTPCRVNNCAVIHFTIGARHETVNRRFQQFGALVTFFRGNINGDSITIFSIAKLKQVMIQKSDPLFRNRKRTGIY